MISLLGFRMVRSDGRIHALGRFHIGGVAYCVWAFPPNAGGAAHRHVQAHSCHVEYPTVADAVIEALRRTSVACVPLPYDSHRTKTVVKQIGETWLGGAIFADCPLHKAPCGRTLRMSALSSGASPLHG
jgi:hypothetical protein